MVLIFDILLFTCRFMLFVILAAFVLMSAFLCSLPSRKNTSTDSQEKPENDNDTSTSDGSDTDNGAGVGLNREHHPKNE